MINVKERQPQSAMLGQCNVPAFVSVSRSASESYQSADLLLLPKKVASILCVSSHTLSIWRSTRRYPLPYCKIGSRVLYRQSDVFAFIESRMEGK
jgi:hypothetical protein